MWGCDYEINLLSTKISMTTSKLLSLSASALLTVGGLSMNAAEVDFSYTYGAENTTQVGTGKAETYDIAIRLSDASLMGSKIKSFNVPFPEAEGISNISVWASKELTLEKKVNIPDITSVEAACVDGYVNVTFPEMIEIPEGGLYVGYTFTVDKKDDATSHPVFVAGAPVEDGLYMHTNRTYLKWKSYAATLGYSSAITVTLDGDFQANALGVSSVKDPFATPGAEAVLATTVVNHGSEDISNIEYVVSGIGNDAPLTYTFDEPLHLYFGQSMALDLPFVSPMDLSEYPISVEITKVNGVENLDKANSGSALLLVLNQVPVHKPLMEEYTGTWCGYCPRGFVGLERMNSLYPEDFVAISYHNGDAMERTSNFPSPVSGFPAAYFDRIYSIDAYYGDTNIGFGIEPFWQSVRDEFTPAVVNGSAMENEDGSIVVNSEISFIKSVTGSYKVAYAIAADGLTDESWGQSNYYSGENPAAYVPEMEKFCTGGSKVYGLVFDDVFAAGSNLKGEESSLIENVVKDQLYSHEYTFGAEEGMSTSNYNLFLRATELYAVIMLLDESGAIVNTNKVFVENHKYESGVDSIEAAGMVKAEYFDLSGRRVDNPSNGIFVKVATMENGSKVTSKVVLK